MTKTTLAGMILDPLGISQWRGALYDTIVEQEQLDPSDVRDNQPRRIPLLGPDHNPGDVIGEVHYLERTAAGAIIAVAVADIDLTSIDETLWFSAGTLARRRHIGGRTYVATDAVIDHLAVVPGTASSCTTPLTILPGDLIRADDRARWTSVPPLTRGHLDRALSYTRARQRHQPHHIAYGPGAVDPDEMYRRTVSDGTAGLLRHGAGGRVLDVRR